MGFRLRLVELRRGAVNVVLQPGHWDVPRVDHFGIALDEGEYETVLDRAGELGLKIQDHPGKRTFVTTEAGYRLEVHPPRDWIEEALSQSHELHLDELHLRASDPEEKAVALSEILDLDRTATEVIVGDTIVRFLPGGPEGRPELVAEVTDVSSYEAAGVLLGQGGGDRGAPARRGRLDGREVGGFAGLYPLDDERLLAATTDGVGTKLVLSRRAGRLSTRVGTSPRTASTTC